MARIKDIDEQMQIIRRGTVEVISEQALRAKVGHALKVNRPLVVKAGFDPSTADIHLGHTVLLRKLRHFQQLGHRAVFLIGDFTAMIGDPTGRTKTRPRLTKREVLENAKTYQKQIAKILDVKKLKIVFNSQWLGKMTPYQLAELMAKYTLARLLERDDFRQRYKQGRDISLSEFFYPLLQAYDSVVLKADVELGGADQKFNLIMTRTIQERFGQRPQAVITMPLLEGTDGTRKMSKSFKNYIGINEPAKDMYGKIMSISDELMKKYYELLTDVDLTTIKKMHPMQAKKKLAREIVQQYHGVQKAKRAQEDFEKVVQKRQVPTDIQVIPLSGGPYSLNQVFDRIRSREEFRFAGIHSRSELLRRLKAGAVDLDGKRMAEANSPCFEAGKEYLLRIGKHFFVKIAINL